MIPSNELTKFLVAVQDKSWFPAFEKSLPVAGASERFVGGTLRYRMTSSPAEGNVTAKTGSLTGVSTLSGYVTSKDGKKLAFSIMFNNYLAIRIQHWRTPLQRRWPSMTFGKKEDSSYLY